MNLIKVKVEQDAPAHTYHGFTYEGYKCGTTFPVDVKAGDLGAVDTDSGQPYSLYRPGEGVIWVYRPDPNTVTLQGTWQGDLEAIRTAFGM